MKFNKKSLLFLFLMLTVLLASCQTDKTSSNQISNEGQSQSQSEQSGETVESEPVENSEQDSSSQAAEPEETGPQVGGTFIWAVTQEPTTLDPSKAGMAVEDYILGFTGSSLVYSDGYGGYVPYLAESWTTSEDGLIWEFKLREDVYFQNGIQLTAHDYAWTFNRAIDPEISSPAAGPMLGDIDKIEAVDDFTLRITLMQPNYPLLYGLADPGYMQPINQATLEEMGDDAYSRNPVSVGPYSVKEWVTGEYVLLERNPDFNWGPEVYENRGAPYLEFIEFRVIPEYATIVAGMEAGEIDYASIDFIYQDIEILQETGEFDIFTVSEAGLRPYITLNLTQAPFDDILVRKAVNLGLDRQTMINLSADGKAEIQYGPLSSSVAGYWDGVEEMGYQFDPALARSYLEEAGYSLNENGIYQKDDLELSFTLKASAAEEKTAQIIKEQLKDIGVDVTIELLDLSILVPALMGADYSMALLGLSYSEADLLYLIFHSSNVGALNFSQLQSEEMDAMLEATRNATDAETRQEACNEAQKYIIEQAYVVPLYAAINSYPIGNRVKNINIDYVAGTFELSAAYIED